MTMLAGGKWIDCAERNPEKYGKYRVICLKRGQRTEDDYLWNGGYWVTPGGSPSKGVQSWWEQAAPAGETGKPEHALQDGTAGRVLTLADYEARIHLYKEQIGTGYIGIGRTLNEAKEAKVVPHGQWESWVTETTGLTPRQAQRCMQAAAEIREGSAMARLEMSKALMLLSSGLDEETREEIAGKAAEEGATVKDLREQLKQAKLKLVQETGAGMEIRDALRKAEDDLAQMQDQMKAAEQGYKTRLDMAREDAYKRGEGAGKMDAAAEIRQLKKDLEINKQRLDDAYRDNQVMVKENREKERERAEAYSQGSRDAAAEADRKMIGLQNELNKQRQYAEDLRRELDSRKDAAVPEDFAKDREILLAAAADAEKRAADAEAELEMLRAGGAGQPDPLWKVLKMAAERFMTDCEMMPMDPAKLISDRNRIVANVNWIGSWVDMMRKALDTAVPAEGAVE